MSHNFEQEHGEPGGPSGEPTRRVRFSQPVHFEDMHPLFNDPDANPFIAPYTGSPNDPTVPGTPDDQTDGTVTYGGQLGGS